MIATVIIWMAFAAALVSTYAYYQSATTRKMLVPLARRSFLFMAGGVVAVSVLLMMYILRHQFEYGYIWSYSSRDLPSHLLITTFWAGQEGSFLFWALCSTLIGIGLQRYTQRQKVEFEVMAVYGFVQAFLLLLLIVKSPFQYIWDAYPEQMAVGAIPADGKGLNPLLQNFWMIIHPPVLFVGFAAMEVPFCFAVAALWKKTFREWIPKALPWVLFGVLWLGAGIMIGGYWAYGVLGWGGWWGWDPVENSSLIPWITGVALLHTLVVQKLTGNLARTNFFLAILTFSLIVYSTFLTRSGVLGSASVHSFTDPGSFVYTLLVAWLLGVAGLGFGLLARRWTELKPLAGKVGMMTRESLISIMTAVLAASAIIIFFGTSWPIVGNSTVEPSFYDRMNLPIAIALAFVLGISLLVLWRQESAHGLMKRASFALGASGLVLLGLLLSGLDEWSMALLAFASLFAFFVNLTHGYRLSKQGWFMIGGPMAHIGLALLFLGIIGSGFYGQKETTSLTQGQPKEVLGYTLTYTGSQPTENGKWKFLVKADREGGSFLLEPVMFKSSYNDQIMRNPDYASFMTKDFYIEPVSVERATAGGHEHHAFDLSKGVATRIGDMSVTFVRFEMNQHGMEGMMGGASGFPVGAVLEVVRDGKKETVTAVTLYKEGQQPEVKPAVLKDGKTGFSMLSMNINPENKTSSIQVEVAGLDDHAEEAAGPEMLVIEASIKPFISLIWVAATLISIGLFLSIVSKVRTARLEAGIKNHREGDRGNGKSKPVQEKEFA
ncbi:MAG: cytochrome c biogenesis protein CcsA [Ignavibacteriales bacterium]|nr:cytochrome c biogenesis protein CcsA [Ignavibacteriales bacterium]